MTKQSVAVNLSANDEIPRNTLGQLHVTPDGSHFRYMKCDATGASANLLYTFDVDTWTLDAALTTTVAAAGESHSLCVTHVALTANYYGWVFVGPGREIFTSAGAITAQKALYTSATAGKIDDTYTGHIRIPGLTAYDAFASAVTGYCYASCGLYVANPL